MPREILPNRRPHNLHPMEYKTHRLTVGIGFYDFDETRPGEIFIDTEKTDGSLSDLARDAAVLASIALQFGADLRTMWDSVNKVRHEWSLGGQKPTEAAGILGAALDALRGFYPHLFEEAPKTLVEYCHPAPGEPSFILLGRDPQAPGLVEVWAEQRAALEPDSVKPTRAYEIASAMRAFKASNPDLGMPMPTDGIDLSRVNYSSVLKLLHTDAVEKYNILFDQKVSVDQEIEFLKRENGSLHDQVAALSDELQQAKDEIERIKFRELDKPIPHIFDYGEHVVHRKKGETYKVLKRDAHLNVSSKVGDWDVSADRLTVVVYENIVTGSWEVRALDEFDDGRFSPINLDGGMMYFDDMPSVIRRNVPGVPNPIRDQRQKDMSTFIRYCWGDLNAEVEERALRWLEEVFEVIQALPILIHADQITNVLRKVWDRPIGKLPRELGGASVTFLGLCEAVGYSADRMEIDEFARILQKDPEELRRRHQAKVDAGYALQGLRPNYLPSPEQPFDVKMTVRDEVTPTVNRTLKRIEGVLGMKFDRQIVEEGNERSDEVRVAEGEPRTDAGGDPDGSVQQTGS